MNKLFLALVAFFAFVCVASAALQQSDLLSVDELSLLQQQIQMGFFNEQELLVIAEALEAQENFLVQKDTSNQGFVAKVKAFFSNTYVQYTALGLATAIVLAIAVTLCVVAVKKFRASKQDKQSAAATEEEKGLLQPYDTVV